MLGYINQRLFARWTLKRKYGSWFDVDWRKKYQTISDADWIDAYNRAWKHRSNDCVEETDAERIAAALDAPGSLLEVGCGTGSLAIRLARKGFRVSGVDVSSEALLLARHEADNEGLTIEWHQGFAEKLPFPDKSFDYVTCCHTLEHVRDLEAAVMQLKRIARRKVIVLVPRQTYKLYANNYHTQFFETADQLIEAIGIPRATCTEIDCTDHANEFQGTALLYVGTLNSQTMDRQL